MKAECRGVWATQNNVNKGNCNVLNFSRVYIFFNCRKYQWHKQSNGYSALKAHKGMSILLSDHSFLGAGSGSGRYLFNGAHLRREFGQQAHRFQRKASLYLVKKHNTFLLKKKP